MSNSKALIDSYISHYEFVPVKNLLREYSEMKEEKKSLKLLWDILYCKRKFKFSKN